MRQYLPMQRALMGVATGALFALGTAGCGGGGGDDHPRFSLYAANYYGGTLSQYDRNSDGTLTALSPSTVTVQTPAGSRGANTITFSPGYKVAYVADQSANVVTQYTIASNGKLTRINNVPTGRFPSVLTPDPLGKFAYSANEGDNTISQYLINADGTLKPNGSFTAATDVGHVTFGPGSHYLYITSFFGNSISQYPIKADGTLGPALSTQPTGIKAFASQFSIDKKYLYVTNLGTLEPPYNPAEGNTISEFRLNADGSLTPIGTVAAGSGPAFMGFTPDGRYAYVGNLHGTTITEFSINSDGTLKKIGTVEGINQPVQVLVDPKGQYAYAPVSGNTNAPTPEDNTVAEFRINSNGTLTKIGSIPTGNTPDYVALAPHF